MTKRLVPLLLSLLSVPAIFCDRASEPVGYYSNGRLTSGVDLPESGPGYMRLFTQRNRGWGTTEMIGMP